MMTRLPTIIVDVVVCLLSVTVSSAQSPVCIDHQLCSTYKKPRCSDDWMEKNCRRLCSLCANEVSLRKIGAAGPPAASPVEEEQSQGRAPVLRQTPGVQVSPVKHESVRNQLVAFLHMDSGTSGAAGLHVLCLVVEEHKQGQGLVIDVTHVYNLVRGRTLNPKTAMLTNVRLGENGAAGPPAASPVDEEQSQESVPVIHQVPGVQVTPVKHKSVRDQRVAFLDMDSGATGAAGHRVLDLVVKGYKQGQGRVKNPTTVYDLVREPPAVPYIITDPQTSPFSAGVTVTLTCRSQDLGFPPATLTWDTARQGTRTSPVDDHTTRLVISNLSAEDDGLSVKCLASNTVSPKEKSFVLRVDQNAFFGECHASASSSTWEVTGYCNITKVFSSNNRYNCQWREIKGNNPYNNPSSFNLSQITPGGKLQRGKCGFQTSIPQDFSEQRELSRGLKYQMYFNPGGTLSPIINVFVVSPKAPTLTCPADVTEGSHINCTCSTSDLGEPQGRLLLYFFKNRLQHTGQYGQKVIFLSRDVGREDNNVRVSCLLHWARNMSADRDWTLRVMYPPGMPSLRINRQTTDNYTTNVNNNVDFTCQVSPSNVESLKLLKVTRNGSQILSGLSISYLSFRIEKAGCGDSGIYYCRAGNSVGQTNSTSVQLNVLCSPKLVNGTSTKSKELKVTEGSQGQLTFEVMGYPAPTIDGVNYHQGDSMSKEEPVRADLFTWKCEQNTPDLHLVTCTLSTADAMNKDNGMYNVKVRNSGGSINVPITLIVDAQELTGNDSSLSWIGLVIALLIIIVIGVLIVFFVRRRRAAQAKTSEDKTKISSTAIARRNFEDPVYYNVTVADVTMPSSAATITSATCTIHNGSAALTSPNDNVYTNYEKKTSLNDTGESSAGTASDDLYAIVDKTQKSSENSGKPPKPAPMPKPKRSGSASGKSGDNGRMGQSGNDNSVQDSGDHSPPASEAANATVNEEGLFYTELDFSQHRPQSQRPLPQKEETNYAAIDFKLQK